MAQPLIEPDQINLDIGFKLLPTGAIVPFGGSVAPTGFLLCDGSAVSRSTYATLFSIIGVTYGVGDGSTTFNLPDLSGRAPVGVGGSAFTSLGATPGAETHILSTSEIPLHNHTGSITVDSGGNHNHTGSTASAGDHSHSLNIGVPSTGGSTTASAPSGTASAGTALTAGAHAHTVTIDFGGSHAHTGSVSINNAGGGDSHNNIQPSIALNFIIAT